MVDSADIGIAIIVFIILWIPLAFLLCWIISAVTPTVGDFWNGFPLSLGVSALLSTLALICIATSSSSSVITTA